MIKVKYLLSLLGILMIVTACKKNNEGVLLLGTIRNAHPDYLYLSMKGMTDSTPIASDGTFKYRLIIKEPEFLKIYFVKNNPLHLLIAPDEKIKITIDGNNFAKNYIVSGSEGSLLIQELMTNYFLTIDRMDSLKKRYNEKMMYGTFKGESVQQFQDSINMQMEEVITLEKEYLKQYIINNSHSFAAMSALYQTFDAQTSKPLLLEEPENISFFQLVDSTLMALYPESQTVQDFHLSLIHLKMSLQKENSDQSTKQQVKVSLGDIAPEIKLPDVKNNIRTLSELRGTYVLLDFWASWCIPCRKENPSIIEAYEMYNKKGFTVFQVSLDNSKEAWISAIEKDSLVWNNHVIADGKWNSEVVQNYGINAIPQNFLIDPSGKIIDINLNGSKLKKRLEGIFKSK